MYFAVVKAAASAQVLSGLFIRGASTRKISTSLSQSAIHHYSSQQRQKHVTQQVRSVWLRLSGSGTVLRIRAVGVDGRRQRTDFVGSDDVRTGQGGKQSDKKIVYRLGLVALVFALAGVPAWRMFGFPGLRQKSLPPRIMEPPDGFCEKFKHPYQKKSLIFRLRVVMERIVYLSWNFATFAVVSVVMVLWRGDKMRERWLDELIRGLQRAGCAFQKFGQVLSMRPDMVPADVIQALSTLRQDAPEHTLEETRYIVRSEWGKEIEDVFEFFDPVPVASGTVAQLHRARLKAEYAMEDGGVDVAVKVRHPKVLQESFVDIELIFAFINGIGEMAGHLTIPFTKDEFQQIFQKQIDFRWEAYNLSRFRHNFHGEESLVFPAVDEELLAPGILVETWIPGSTMSSLFTELGPGLKVVNPGKDEGPEMRSRKARFAKILYDMTMKMFLRDNLIHGDLHGGNVMHMKDTVSVIDTGLVTGVAEEIRGVYVEFLKALCRGDVDALVQRLVGFSERRALSDAELNAFRADVALTVSRWVSGSRDPEGGPMQLGDLVGELLFKIQKHKMSLRGDVASTIVSMSMVEGLVRQLDPDFDVVGTALPYFFKYPVKSGDARINVMASQRS